MKIKVAATQLNIVLGDVKSNLEKAIKLIEKAARQKAEVIALPEFFTSAIAINPIMDDVPEKNRKCQVIETMQEKAKNLHVTICGSILQMIDEDIYNSMFLIESNGKTFIHNKDIPTQFENKYYRDGDTRRNCGIYGLALCWEMLRSKTIRELGKNIKIALTGSCWWGLPERNSNLELKKYNETLCRETPRHFAAIAGIPVVHSSLKGSIYGDRNLRSSDQVKRPLIGMCQIVDAKGNIIKSIIDNDEDAILVEEIELGKREIHETGTDFWLVDLREEYINAWRQENALGKEQYQKRMKWK